MGYYDSFLQWVSVELANEFSSHISSPSLSLSQLSRAIDDGFISSPSVDELLIVESDPCALVERLYKHHQSN